MRWNRATVSVWVYEKTCPMCSSPDTVGGGVSIAYTSARALLRSNVYVPSSCQRRAHLSSRPSSAAGACHYGLTRRSAVDLARWPMDLRTALVFAVALGTLVVAHQLGDHV